MHSKKAVLGLCLSILLYGCGEEDGSEDSSGASNLYSNIAVQSANIAMNSSGYCTGTNAKWRTEHFIIGTKGTVSDDKIKEIARIAQNALNTDSAAYSWNAWSDLKIDYDHPLEICVIASEGSNGAGNYDGFVIGPDRKGTDLDNLVKHEIKHTYQARFIGKTGLNQAHVWFAEAVATAFSTNETVNADTLSAFISDTGMTPTQVTNDGLQQGVQMRLSNGGSEYGSYNTALRYLQNQGASIQDIWNIFKKMGEIEQSCKDAHQAAINNNEMVNPISELSTSCSGDPTTYSSGATIWNGQVVSGSIEDHIAQPPEPGKSKFVVAFNSVMGAYGISYDDIDDTAAFRNTVMNNL